MAFSHTTGFAGSYGDAKSFFAKGRAAGRTAYAKYEPHGRRAALDRLDRLATWFDTAFIVPGTSIRFGLESLLRLIPGFGDAAASALSCYLLLEAYKLDVPTGLFARMVANVLLEGTVGVVPLAGDAFDVMFRANRRNIALLREHFARTGY